LRPASWLEPLAPRALHHLVSLCSRVLSCLLVAAEGVLFGNHFGQAVPCAPGRASLYTGMYTMNNGVGTNQSPLDAGHTNWAKELRSLGYEPALAGYTDIASDPRGKAPGDPTNHMYGELDGLHSLEPIGRAPDNGTANGLLTSSSLPSLFALLYFALLRLGSVARRAGL
jgi:arylsulfatase A-like enzyme